MFNLKLKIAIAVKRILDKSVETRLLISKISISQIKKYKIKPISIAVIVSFIFPPTNL